MAHQLDYGYCSNCSATNSRYVDICYNCDARLPWSKENSEQQPPRDNQANQGELSINSSSSTETEFGGVGMAFVGLLIVGGSLYLMVVGWNNHGFYWLIKVSAFSLVLGGWMVKAGLFGDGEDD